MQLPVIPSYLHNTRKLTLPLTLIRRGVSQQSRRTVLTGEKKQPLSSQQTSMSGCNAKRDTTLIYTVRGKQVNSKLSRYHRSQRNTRLLAVSAAVVYSNLKNTKTISLPCRALVVNREFVTKCSGQMGMPGQKRSYRSVGTWSRTFIAVFMSQSTSYQRAFLP